MVNPNFVVDVPQSHFPPTPAIVLHDIGVQEAIKMRILDKQGVVVGFGRSEQVWVGKTHAGCVMTCMRVVS